MRSTTKRDTRDAGREPFFDDIEADSVEEGQRAADFFFDVGVAAREGQKDNR